MKGSTIEEDVYKRQVLGGILGASSVDLGVEVGGRGSFKAINEQVSLVKMCIRDSPYPGFVGRRLFADRRGRRSDVP